MISLKKILTEAKGKKLRIFDFDGTLANSDARVIMVKKSGERVTLPAGSYHTVPLEDGDEYDFSQFADPVLTEPKPINYTLKIIKYVNSVPLTDDRRIVILTARPQNRTVAIEKFIKEHGLHNVEIVGTGDLYPILSDSEKKKKWIKLQIKRGFTDIQFFDDLEDNLNKAKELEREFPDVKIVTRLIKSYLM